MKTFRNRKQIFLLLLLFFLIALSIYELLVPIGSSGKTGADEPEYNNQEEYDANLAGIRDMEKLSAYVDSIYVQDSVSMKTVRFDTYYPEVAVKVIRKRFYHGYSFYGLGNNYMALMFSKISFKGLNAIVLPEDILKFPYAACSQQTIVLMKLLRDKGFKTRKVTFLGKNGGHFCFEVFYNGSWHFMDPNMEPDPKVMQDHHRPSIAFLSANPEVLLKAYYRYPKEKILDLFSNYEYGKVNAPPAPRASIFQQATKVLSYTSWLLVGLFYFLLRKRFAK